MSNLPKRYRYEYRLTLDIDRWRHVYIVTGRHGALHLHITDLRDGPGGFDYGVGLEIHYREPPDGMRDEPPSHSPCVFLGQSCWHVGTSMYAREAFLPLFNEGYHEPMLRALAYEADRRFDDNGARNNARESEEAPF